MRRAACLAVTLAGLLAAAPAPAHAQSTVTVIGPSGDDVAIVRQPRHERPRYAAPHYRPRSYDAGTGIVPPLIDTYTPTQRTMAYPYPYRRPPDVVIVQRPAPPPSGAGVGHRPPPTAVGLDPRR